MIFKNRVSDAASFSFIATLCHLLVFLVPASSDSMNSTSQEDLLDTNQHESVESAPVADVSLLPPEQDSTPSFVETLSQDHCRRSIAEVLAYLRDHQKKRNIEACPHVYHDPPNFDLFSFPPLKEAVTLTGMPWLISSA
ncbi:uncharacterized protein ARMOST_02779 [Armillaria ostoyae]|uniref:Uncharacterized protein n=1 Tax=Armillaria ostoyae TaxID=47428 RepID=A0A284QSQ1_ARMOS|nr:uncharacterized protein ARMOST_02779 [Armillaria ostoyae]